MPDILPAYTQEIVAGLRSLGMEPPEKVVHAERTRAGLVEEHRKAQAAAASVSTIALRDRFENEALEAAESDKPMPNYAEELAGLQSEQAWRGIAVAALDDAVNRAGYRVIAAVDESMTEIYDGLRAAWTATMDKIRSVAPVATTLPLENPEAVLRSGDKRAIGAYSTLADASDALLKIATVQRHLREAQNGRGGKCRLRSLRGPEYATPGAQAPGSPAGHGSN